MRRLNLMLGKLVLGLSILLGCEDKADTTTEVSTATPATVDADGDGFMDTEDCNDSDAAISPASVELCDGVDNDCDGDIDEGVGTTWYADADGDGFGDADAATESCSQPTGHVAASSDCDDTSDEIYPGAPERCDGLDNNCDGQADEGKGGTWYLDADGDGWGDGDALDACEAPSSAVDRDGDCDDTDADVRPDAEEICDGKDNYCDGDTEEDVLTTFYQDTDGDGYGETKATTEACDAPSGFSEDDGDCNDLDAAIHPGADESDCTDPTDYNCDGSVGWSDDDGDGYAACEECDDTAADINPAATEICNGDDDDCDGYTDDDDKDVELSTGSDWYSDDDADGYGDADTQVRACDAPSGYISTPGDCDDSAADINPGATEICDALDNDCDSLIDDEDGDLDATTAGTWYADDDGDGFGSSSGSTVSCDAPSGAVTDDTDCDDTDDAINPDAEEICDGEDNDCNGYTDDDDSGVTGTSIWYADADADGWGATAYTSEACDQPSGSTATDGDCDDGEPSTNPGATEACDGADNDCDGDTDEGLLGSGASCPAESCLEILNEGSSTGDGSYTIDFGGVSTETECDMSTDGGGWTLVFEDDFESGADPGWNMTTTYSCGSWTTILGGYCVQAGGELTNSVDTFSIPHDDAWVLIDYIALDSWDNETAYVAVGGSTVWSVSQNNHSDSYAEVCGWDRGYNGSYDSRHPIETVMASGGSSIDVLAGSTLDQDACDESFGVDDVEVWLR